MREKPFVDFVLLHAYSLDKFSLMYGKMGCALCLFEYSRIFHYELAEKHAFELLQEVLASSLSKNTFNDGKMGIAWSLIYLIRNQFIDAEYLDLYGQEHAEIIAFIKQLRTEPLNLDSKVDAVSFLTNTKLYLSDSDFNENLSSLIDSIYSYLKNIPNNIFECHAFYYVATKILAYYNCYKELHFDTGKLIDAVIQTHIELANNGYVCNNLSFGVNLLQYGISYKSEDIIVLSNAIVNCCISNIILEAFDLRELIGTIYNLNKLHILNQKSEYFLLKEELSKLLFNKKSYLYETGHPALNTLKEGIPKLLFMTCLNEQSIDSYGHLIMLQ